jgi:hypothetical protein
MQIVAVVHLAHGQLIVHGSTPRRISPSRADILTILYNARHSGIPTGKRKHLGASGAIVLRVILQEWSASRVIMISGLLTIRTAGFCINY